ncbi:MAG TPA: hypothetical protein DEF05_03390 [Erwinia sp.]|nr:hypothetical protein [Erwinia sp.]
MFEIRPYSSLKAGCYNGLPKSSVSRQESVPVWSCELKAGGIFACSAYYHAFINAASKRVN